jgi:hypothetical protein
MLCDWELAPGSPVATDSHRRGGGTQPLQAWLPGLTANTPWRSSPFRIPAWGYPPNGVLPCEPNRRTFVFVDDQSDSELVGWIHDAAVVSTSRDSIAAHAAWNAIAPRGHVVPPQQTQEQRAAYRRMLDADEAYARAKLSAMAIDAGRRRIRSS